ncbi:MAG: hypothetical protein IJA31_02500 [Clostridia bacterium]|nr:hypothetical protein [Clostridia bacterium]
MYKLVETDKEIKKVRAFCSEGYFGARINTAIAAYETDDRFVRTWFEESDGAVVGVMQITEDAAVVKCTAKADFESLAALLLFAGAKTVIGNADCIAKLPFVQTDKGYIMSAEKTQLPLFSAEKTDSEQLPLLYPVLFGKTVEQADRRAYMAWFADLSHRVRHGLSEWFYVAQNNAFVSCAGILYSNAQYACIGGVATLPEARKRGFGRICTLTAARSALQNGQIPCLACADNGIEKWYAGMGFAVCGQWMQMKI